MLLFGLLVLVLVYALAKYLVRLAVNHHLVSPRHQTALLLSWFFILLVASRFIVYKLNIKTRGYDGHDRDELTDEEATLRTEEFIRHIKEVCGSVCDVPQDDGEELVFRRLTKDFQCRSLMSEKAHDRAGTVFKSGVPQLLSDKTIDYFTYGGRLRLTYDYHTFDLSPPTIDWTEAFLEDQAELVKAQKYEELHGVESMVEAKLFDELVRAHLDLADSKGSVLVLRGGTDSPWVEATLLARGADSVWAVDRVGVDSRHPKVKVIHPNQFSNHVAGSSPSFYAVIAFKSLQSLGLGRLGEGLHPWADLVALARATCTTQPKARLVLALPRGDADEIVFNDRRIYGPLLQSVIMTNWATVYEAPDVEDIDGNEYLLRVLQRS